MHKKKSFEHDDFPDEREFEMNIETVWSTAKWKEVVAQKKKKEKEEDWFLARSSLFHWREQNGVIVSLFHRS